MSQHTSQRIEYSIAPMRRRCILSWDNNRAVNIFEHFIYSRGIIKVASTPLYFLYWWDGFQSIIILLMSSFTLSRPPHEKWDDGPLSMMIMSVIIDTRRQVHLRWRKRAPRLFSKMLGAAYIYMIAKQPPLLPMSYLMARYTMAQIRYWDIHADVRKSIDFFVGHQPHPILMAHLLWNNEMPIVYHLMICFKNGQPL